MTPKTCLRSRDMIHVNSSSQLHYFNLYQFVSYPDFSTDEIPMYSQLPWQKLTTMAYLEHLPIFKNIPQRVSSPPATLSSEDGCPAHNSCQGLIAMENHNLHTDIFHSKLLNYERVYCSTSTPREFAYKITLQSRSVPSFYIR